MTQKEIQLKYLKDGEEILWFKKPDKLGWLSRTDIFLLPLTLFTGSCLLYYAYLSFTMMITGKNAMFSVTGITVVLVALYLLFGRIWYRRKRLSRNIYVVTNMRAVIINTLSETVTADIPLYEVYPRKVRNDLYLAEQNLFADIAYGLGLDLFFRNVLTESPAFYAISDADKVIALLKKYSKKRKANANDSEFI